MPACANCEHGMGHHGSEGCEFGIQGIRSCTCPFGYSGGRRVSCKGTYTTFAGRVVECINDSDCNGSPHSGYFYPNDARPSRWFNEESDKPVIEAAPDEPVANPNRTTRDEQVGGNHYRQFKIQPWDVIDEYGLDFYRGNVVKYLLRAGHKGVKLEDLKKARHYLDRVIEIEEGK